MPEAGSRFHPWSSVATGGGLKISEKKGIDDLSLHSYIKAHENQ